MPSLIVSIWLIIWRRLIKDKEWLDHELKVNGYDNYDNILFSYDW